VTCFTSRMLSIKTSGYSKAPSLALLSQVRRTFSPLSYCGAPISRRSITSEVLRDSFMNSSRNSAGMEPKYGLSPTE